MEPFDEPTEERPVLWDPSGPEEFSLIPKRPEGSLLPQTEPLSGRESMEQLFDNQYREFIHNLRRANRNSPEELAARQRYAAQLNVPLMSVEGVGMADINDQFLMDKAAGVQEDTPVLQRALTDEAKAHFFADIEQLSGMEKTFSNLGRGVSRTVNQQTISQFGIALMTGQEIDEDRLTKFQIAQTQLRRLEDTADELNGFEHFFNLTTMVGTDVVYSLRLSLPSAAAGGVTGAVIGAGTGALTGPGAAITTGGGFVTGASLGFKLGMAADAVLQITGASYVEYASMVDINGRVMDPDVAAGAALISGVFGGGLEFVGSVSLAKAIPGVDKLLSRGGPKAVVAKLMQTPQGRGVLEQLGRTASASLKTGGIEAVTEMAQAAIEIFAGEGAKVAMGEDYAFQAVSGAEMLNAMQEAGVQSFIGATGLRASMAAPRIPMDSALHARKVRYNQSDAGALDRLESAVEQAAKSSTLKNDPEGLEKFVDDAAENTDLSKVHISPAALAQIEEEADLQPGELAARLGISKKEIAEAENTGTDVAVRTGKFVSAAAKDKTVFEKLMSVTRTRAQGLTRNEIDEYQKLAPAERQKFFGSMLQQAMKDDQFRLQLETITTNVLNELNAVGRFAPSVNEQYAAITAYQYGTLALELGITPDEAIVRHPLNVRKMLERADENAYGMALEQAKSEGYEGDSGAEAVGWVNAKKKGYNMEQPARHQRAEEQGFYVNIPVYRSLMPRSSYRGDAQIDEGGEAITTMEPKGQHRHVFVAENPTFMQPLAEATDEGKGEGTQQFKLFMRGRILDFREADQMAAFRKKLEQILESDERQYRILIADFIDLLFLPQIDEDIRQVAQKNLAQTLLELGNVRRSEQARFESLDVTTKEGFREALIAVASVPPQDNPYPDMFPAVEPFENLMHQLFDGVSNAIVKKMQRVGDPMLNELNRTTLDLKKLALGYEVTLRGQYQPVYLGHKENILSVYDSTTKEFTRPDFDFANENTWGRIERLSHYIERSGDYDIYVQSETLNDVGSITYGIIDPKNLRSVNAAFDPDEAGSLDILAQTVTLRTGEETLAVESEKKTPKTIEIARALERRQRQKYGIIGRDDKSDEARENIASWAVEEILYEVEQAKVNPEKSAVGWYSQKFQRALDEFGAIFPELRDDSYFDEVDESLPGVALLGSQQGARNFFTALIAVTSDGAKVADNFRFAVQVMEEFRKTGRIDTEVTFGADRNASMRSNLQAIQTLMDEFGAEGMHDYLLQLDTVSNLKKRAKESGQSFNTAYKATMELPYSAISFGPKLGAFYANLMGETGYLTMDRWWSRTFNRYRGTITKAPTKQGMDRLRVLITEDRKLNEPPEMMTDDEVLSYAAEYAASYKKKGFKNGTEIEKAANTVYKDAFESLEDQPFNATDREFMINTTQRMQEKLRDDHGINLTVADIQAVLWYYEKRLYAELGARATADISYEETARKLINDRNFGRTESVAGPEQGLDAISPEGDARERTPAEDFDAKPESLAQEDDTTGRRGEYVPDLAELRIGPSSNLSTYLHELGHHFLEVYNTVSRSLSDQERSGKALSASERRILDDHKRLLVELARQTNTTIPPKTDPLEWWKGLSFKQREPMHELFARLNEAYLMSGKAPIPELKGLFRRFRSWLLNVYKSMEDLKVELSPEVVELLGRMYASKRDIEETNSEQRLNPLFSVQPSFMTDSEWAAYTQMAAEAINDAEDELFAKTIDIVKWLSGAKSKALKKLQWQAEEKRRVVKAEVTAEFNKKRVYQTIELLRKGIGPDGKPATFATKMDAAILEKKYGKRFKWKKLGYGQYGMLVKEGGMDPDVLAGMMGYPSGEAMIKAILDAPNKNAEIKKETDKRMLEQFGDMLDPAEMDAAANEAVHNKARAKILRAEFDALSKATGKNSRIIQMMYTEGGRDIAQAMVARMTASKLSVDRYLAAAQRAGVRADRAIGRDDLEAAAKAKADQLLNLEMVREISRQLKARDKALDFFNKIITAKEKTVSKTRDFTKVQVARAILEAYGRGRKSNKTDQYLQLIKKYDPDLFETVIGEINSAMRSNQKLTDLSVEKLMGLNDLLQSLWQKSRDEKTVEIEGKKQEAQKIVDQLVVALKKLKGLDPDSDSRLPPDEQKHSVFQSFMAANRRIEGWTRAADAGGPPLFHRYIFRPFSNAADEMRAKTLEVFAKYRALWEPIRDGLETGPITAPELKDEFGRPYVFSGKYELLHAMLNTGNSSNKTKLLLGMGWATEINGVLQTQNWDAFVKRMFAQGVLTKEDMDFAQAVWDLMDELKPAAQKAHFKVFGRYFSEITAEEVVTPVGTYRGGYVPVRYDPVKSKRAQDKKLDEREAHSAMFPQPNKDFTKSRTGYIDVIHLDVNVLSQHIAGVINFTYMQPVADDMRKILQNKEFQAALKAYDPYAYQNIIQPFAERAISQSYTHKPSDSNPFLVQLNQLGTTLRTRSGMSIMMANLANAVMGVSGFAVAALRVKPHRMAASLRHVLTSRGGLAESVREMSTFMRNRGNNQMSLMYSEIEQIIGKKGPIGTVAEWSLRHAYFMQQALQNQLDVIVWDASYQESRAKGIDHDEAVQIANMDVRETQVGLSPEDQSLVESQQGWVKLFTMFLSYMNNWGNLLNTEVAITVRDVGVKKGAGKIFYIYLVGLLIPMVIAEMLAATLRGRLPEDEDDDGVWDDYLQWFAVMHFRTATGMVPGVRDIGSFIAGKFTEARFDDRLNVSPVVSLFETSGGLLTEGQALFDSDKEVDWSNAIKSGSSLTTLITGLPVSVVTKPIQYMVDVAEEDVEPVNALDYTRGVLTGSASRESKE